MTRVSIITPSFNQAQFLEQTIRSVLDQDYPDLEYMIVDGASTDGSVDIIRRYEAHLAWWISEPDRGQSEAINKGMARASGDIVAWLNSDDLYQPGAITRAVEQFQRDPAVGLVFGDVYAIDAAGEVTRTLRYGNWGLEDLMCFSIIGQPAVFMRRSVLEQAGYLDANFHYIMDLQLWLRIAQIAPLNYLPVVLASARFHPAAKNVAMAANFQQEAYALVEWMQSQPILAKKMGRLSPHVRAGAHRFSAYYLVDSNQPAAALKAYWQALRCNPPTVLREWKRVLYAVLSLLGIKGLQGSYKKVRKLLERRKRED